MREVGNNRYVLDFARTVYLIYFELVWKLSSCHLITLFLSAEENGVPPPMGDRYAGLPAEQSGMAQRSPKSPKWGESRRV